VNVLSVDGAALTVDDMAGTFELRVEAAPASAMPREFVTGVARLYAMRTAKRPGDADEVGGTLNLSASILRSGAGEALRAIRRIG